MKKKSVIYWAGCGHIGLDQTLQALIVLPQGSYHLTDRKLAPPKPRVIAEMRFLCKYSTYIVNLRKIANVQKLLRSGHQAYICRNVWALYLGKTICFTINIQISTMAPPSLYAWTPACLLTLLQIQPPLMSHCCIMRPHEMPEISQNCALCNCLAVH